jgi:hypothetical protein
MGRYITESELRAYLFGTSGTIGAGGGTITADQQSLMGTAINNAERAIDTYTRRNFAATAGTYYVNRFGQGQVRGQALYLDNDLHTLVGVVNGDGQTIPVGSAWLEPRNEGPPYRIVRLKSSYAWVWNTDSDVILSGTFGYGTTPPDDIKQAAVRYAAHLYRQKDASGPDNTAGFPEGGQVQYPQGMPSDVRWLLSPYRSRSGGAV